MARNKLSVRGIVALEPGKYCDGAGLWLAKTGLKSGKLDLSRFSAAPRVSDLLCNWDLVHAS